MNINIDNTFVRNLRNYLKLTQEQFAQELNINISTIRSVEQSQRNVPKSMQQAIKNKYEQFIKDGQIEKLNNLKDKTIYVSNDVKAIINICDYYGISQTELSKKTGISRQTLNEIINFKNNKKLSPHVKQAIENVYGQLIHYYDEFQIQATERFIYVRTEIASKSQKDFAKELKIPLPKLIDIENHKKGITENIVKYLEQEYLVNPLWLLEGKENPTKIDDEEAKYFEMDKQTINTTKTPSLNTGNVISIPFYHIAAVAGSNNPLGEEPEKEPMFFDKRFLKTLLKTEDYSNLHVIYAKGDSMDSGWNQPDDIKDGDLLMVDTSQKTGNNQIFVINHNNDLRVKLLKTQGDNLMIISKNKKYNVQHYTFENLEYNNISIVGKVVWNGSKENV